MQYLRTQVKMEDAPRLLKIPKSECPDVWIRLPRQKWPKSWANIEDPVVPLELNLYGHPLAGLLLGKTIRRSFIRTWMGKVPNWECLSIRSSKTTAYCQYMWMTSKWWQEAEYGFHVEQLLRNVDIDEPTSFLDHVYLGCAHRQCKPNETIIEEFSKMFESRISAGATEKLPGWQKLNAKTVAWTYEMEGHAQKMR